MNPKEWKMKISYQIGLAVMCKLRKSFLAVQKNNCVVVSEFKF